MSATTPPPARLRRRPRPASAGRRRRPEPRPGRRPGSAETGEVEQEPGARRPLSEGRTRDER